MKNNNNINSWLNIMYSDLTKEEINYLNKRGDKK
jgi:hypothetical protein